MEGRHRVVVVGRPWLRAACTSLSWYNTYMKPDIPAMKPAGHAGSGFGCRHVLPRPIEAADLARIASRFQAVVGSKIDGPVHLISVAKSGYPIGTAAALELMRSDAQRQVYLSCVDPTADLNTFADIVQFSNCTTILVDNSIKTGETAVQSVKILHDASIDINFIVKLVEYKDLAEIEAQSYISGVCPSAEILSLYSEGEIRQRIISGS